MAAQTIKRASNPRVGNTVAGGTVGYALAQMIVELSNRALTTPLTTEFQASLGIVFLALGGLLAGWITRDRDETPPFITNINNAAEGKATK